MLHEEIPLEFRCRHPFAAHKLHRPTLKFLPDVGFIGPNEFRTVELRNKAESFVRLPSEPELVFFAPSLLPRNPPRPDLRTEQKVPRD